MDWQEQLIKLYLDICQPYQEDLWVYGEGMSPNSIPHFSDEEVITVYLWGTLRGFRTITQIHDYVQDHLRVWFPRLSYIQILGMTTQAEILY